ncbi:MAG: PAS domain S-box protein, partial [Desulfobulbaceae bacterium]|nr:PAS domain S-box protein [Candidatus Desulfobia pelagia]
MTTQELLHYAKQALDEPDSALLQAESVGQFAPIAEFLHELIEENRALKTSQQNTVAYLRQKIDQLLMVIGTIPLRPEELDDDTLISLDPVGIIAESFTQILDHQRQINEELEIAKEEIEVIFESIGGGILVLDKNKQILSYNKMFEDMFCPPGATIKGSFCSDLICKGFPPEGCVLDEVEKEGKAVLKDECFQDERSYSIVASPVKDKAGKLVRSVMLYMDITELALAKAEVFEEKERLSLTLESIAEGVVATDMHGCVTLMNQVAEKLTGFKEEEAVGRPVCEVLHIFEKGEQQSCSQMFKALLRDDGKVERIANTMLSSQDGDEKLITISAAPIRKQDQETSGAILVFRDITHEKKMEEEMQKATKIESLGVLAGGIAHDFNNLLTSILGNISLAKAFSSSDEKITKLLNDAEKGSFRAKNLTQQLLTFARGGAPITTLASTSTLIIESAQFSSSGSKIKCDFDIPEELWSVEVDEVQVGQVIQNLVINADQAMHSGGIVQIAAGNLVVYANSDLALEPGNYIKISVKDDGQGIERKHLGKIFDPYFTTKATGNGLGLAICYSVMKKHHGLIDVESEPGAGSTFCLYLPATEETKTSQSSQDQENPVGGQGRILVMDDEEIVRDVAAQMLSVLGYQVDESSNGEETIELYLKAQKSGQPYDAVIMDLTIPGGMGGKETIVKLREIDPLVKAIVSSGYANDP